MINLTKEDITNKLFEFIYDNFDSFDCKGQNFEWWWLKSWSPYVESCFILWGEELEAEKKIDEIGHSVVRENVFDFMSKIGHETYIPTRKYPDKGFDVSWSKSNELILALEHEETTGEYRGSSVESNLNSINDEIRKLRRSTAIFKVIVTRPRLRKFKGRKDVYPDAIEFYKQELESKLSTVLPENKDLAENWLLILMGPRDRLKPNGQTEILFCSYIFEGSKFNQISENEFKVQMDSNNRVTKVEGTKSSSKNTSLQI